MNRDTYTAQATTWARPSDLQLENFFRDADNFHSGMRVAAVIYAVGPFDFEADWDRGNWVYEWRRKSIRVRVATSSAYVSQVELLNPASTNAFDEPIQVLWSHPEHGRQPEGGG
jgi:hypothetical protein